jgi:hypothetical protein
VDPITASILAAATAGIAAGVAGGATEVAQKAIVDAYNALKAKLIDRFDRSGEIAQAVESLEKNPESEGRQAVVREEIEAAKAFEDPELQGLATKLLEALGSSPQGKAAISKYQVDARWAQIGVMGDETTVKGGIHFGKRPKSE